MRTLKKIFRIISKEKCIDKIKILVNVAYFFIVHKRYSYDKASEFYYKKLLFTGNLKNRKIEYFFQLNSFLELYEDPEFLEEIINSKEMIFIDIGGNIGRISCMANSYNKIFKKILLLEPNTNCTDFIRNIISKDVLGDINILNYGIGYKTEERTLIVSKTELMNPAGAIELEKSVMTNLDKDKHKEINIKLLSFEDFFNENKLNEFKTFFLKIDVEGFEKNVINSIIDFLDKNKGKYEFTVILEILPINEKEMFELFDRLALPGGLNKVGTSGDDYKFKI